MRTATAPLLALVGGFFILAALHGCDLEAKPGDYTKRACARGNAKACQRLCARGFPGYAGHCERKGNARKTPDRRRRLVARDFDRDVYRGPLPVPRPRVDEIDDSKWVNVGVPLEHQIADAFELAAFAPNRHFRPRRSPLTEAHMETLAARAMPPSLRVMPAEPKRGFDWRLVIALAGVALAIAFLLAARAPAHRPKYRPHDPYGRPRPRRRRVPFFDI